MNSPMEPSGAKLTETNHSARNWLVAVAILGGIILSLLAIGIYQGQREPPWNPAALAEKAFRNMSYAQHLAAAQEAEKPGTTIEQIDGGLRHVKAIPPTVVEGVKAKALEQTLQGLRKKRQDERTLIEAKVKRVLRDQMAKNIENSMLDKGYNVDVIAIGKDHTVLHLKWVLVSKVMAHQLAKQGDFFENARKVDFKKVEITDGFKETWYWDLH